jgi:lipopolysaccharide transport system permease protein
VRDLVHYRDLLYTLTLHRIKVRYKQSVLGIAWAIIQPLLLMAIYTIIFSIVTKMPSDGAPYAVFVYAALLPWTLFASSLTTAATSLVAHTNLITKVYFPREILPLTYVLASFFDFVMAAAVLGVLMVWYGVPFTPGLLQVVPVLAVAVMFATAVSLLVSAFQVRFRDIGIAMPLLMQLWLYASPVVYPVSIVPERFRHWYALNPMAGVVENFRGIVIQQKTIDWGLLMPGLMVAAILLPLSYLYFKSTESTLADVI